MRSFSLPAHAPLPTAGEMLARRLQDFVTAQRRQRADIVIAPSMENGQAVLSFYFGDFAKYAGAEQTARDLNCGSKWHLNQYFEAAAAEDGSALHLKTPWYDMGRAWIGQQAVDIVAAEMNAGI